VPPPVPPPPPGPPLPPVPPASAVPKAGELAKAAPPAPGTVKATPEAPLATKEQAGPAPDSSMFTIGSGVTPLRRAQVEPVAAPVEGLADTRTGHASRTIPYVQLCLVLAAGFLVLAMWILAKDAEAGAGA
jgi:hypothetical protein